MDNNQGIITRSFLEELVLSIKLSLVTLNEIKAIHLILQKEIIQILFLFNLLII